MRARMALRYAGIEVEIREVSLKQKPAHMLQLSPKGTVPVLVMSDNEVIEESLEIAQWALSQHDPDGWLVSANDAEALITENDGSFKQALDRYKYATRFPEYPAETYRKEGEVFLGKLEALLNQHQYLYADKISFADVVIFPFIRQFAAVDAVWFESANYPKLQAWLDELTSTELFQSVMQKYPVWVA